MFAPNLYLVRKPHQVSFARQGELRRQSLLPLTDSDPDKPLEPLSEKIPRRNDWIIEYVDSEQPLLFYQVKGYKYLPHKHLYVKHFVSVSYVSNFNLNDMATLFRRELEIMPHMGVFSPEATFFTQKYRGIKPGGGTASTPKKHKRQQTIIEQLSSKHAPTKHKKESSATIPGVDPSKGLNRHHPVPNVPKYTFVRRKDHNKI